MERPCWCGRACWFPEGLVGVSRLWQVPCAGSWPCHMPLGHAMLWVAAVITNAAQACWAWQM